MTPLHRLVKKKAIPITVNTPLHRKGRPWISFINSPSELGFS